MTRLKLTPKEWLSQNPGKTLNDYYKLFGGALNSSNEPRVNVSNYREDTRISKWYFVGGALLVVLILTNPSTIEHERTARHEVSKFIENEAGNWGLLNGVKRIGATWLSQNVVSTSERINFILGSKERVYIGSEYKGFTIGLLGNVWFIQD